MSKYYLVARDESDALELTPYESSEDAIEESSYDEDDGDVYLFEVTYKKVARVKFGHHVILPLTKEKK